MCAEVQRYKILLTSYTRQNQQLQEALNYNQGQTEDLQSQWTSVAKGNEAALKSFDEEKRHLESQLKDQKSQFDRSTRENEELKKTVADLNDKYEKAFSELNDAKEELANVLGGGDSKATKKSAGGYNDQVSQIKEQYNKRMQGMNEELAKLKNALGKKDVQIADYERKLQEDPLMDIVGEGEEERKQEEPEELTQARKLLEVKEGETLQARLEELLAEAEEMKLFKAQHERMEEALKESQKAQNELNAQLAAERSRWTQVEAIQNVESTGEKDQLQKRVKELEAAQDQLGKSRAAAQAQADNTSETLKVKEQEIGLLKQSRDMAEGNEKRLREELAAANARFDQSKQGQEGEVQKLRSERETAMSAFVRLTDGTVSALAFSFMETAFPVGAEMPIEEKLARVSELLDYMKTLRENIESNNTTNVSSIASLKEQLRAASEESQILKTNVVEAQKKRIASLEGEKQTLAERVAALENERNTATKEKSEFEATMKDVHEGEASELQKLKKQVAEERAHNVEVLSQMREMHKAELDAANSNKQVTIGQLDAKVKSLEEKLKRKKQKSVQKLNEAEELLKKQETLLIENEKLRNNSKQAERAAADREAELAATKERLAKLEEKSRKDLDSVSAQVKAKDKDLATAKQSLAEKAAFVQKLQADMADLSDKVKTMEKAKTETRPQPRLDTEECQTDRANSDMEAEVASLRQKLEAEEKAHKLTQQRLLQSYEENNGKISDVQERLKQSKQQCKSLEDEKSNLTAECARLQSLLDEAKADMRKMMAATKKMSAGGSRNSIENASGSAASSQAKLRGTLRLAAGEETVPTTDVEAERTAMRYEEQMSRLEETAANARRGGEETREEMFKILDNLIAIEQRGSLAGQDLSAAQNPCVPHIQRRLEELKSTIERKYAKEIEELREQLTRFSRRDIAVTDTKNPSSATAPSRTLRESIDRLKESLTESERAMEETVQKRIVAERRKIRDEIRRTMSVEELAHTPTERSVSAQPSAESKKQPLGKSTSPNRMSALELQYKSELDNLNNEDVYCGTTRTISFGVPEPVEGIAENREEDRSINNVVEECKRKCEEQKAAELEREWSVKVQECEKETERVKTQLEGELSRIKSEHKAEVGMLRKELEVAGTRVREAAESTQKEYHEKIGKLENDKEREMEELLKLKEKEIKANLNVEFMKSMNEKKEELTRQYTESKETMQREFEQLRQKLNSEVEARTQKLEKDYADLIRETERNKQLVDQKYADRLAEKERLLDNVMKMRIKEVEDEYRIKAEKLEYSIKYEAQCQTERQRAELTEEQKGVEQKYRIRVEELEAKLRNAGAEGRTAVERLESELRQAKEDSDQRYEQLKKKTEKDLSSRTEQWQRKCRDAEDRAGKLRREVEELSKKLAEEKDTAIETAQKKWKDEMRILKEKHKSELRNLRETHKNELIKRNIEKEREMKKMKETHAAELEEISNANKQKEAASKPAVPAPGTLFNLRPLIEEKKDGERLLQQKINTLRRKLESEYQEKEKTMGKSLQEQMTVKFNTQLKEEVDKLKKKYQEKKRRLEDMRTEYESRLRSEMKENRAKDSNSSSSGIKCKSAKDITLSEIDSEEVLREGEEHIKLTERADADRKRLSDQYESRLRKMEDELATATSRSDEKVLAGIQSFIEILVLELDKLLTHANNGGKTSVSTADINRTIAKMIVAITPDGKCRDFLEAFKMKLSKVLFAVKSSIEQQYSKSWGTKQEATAERETTESRRADLNASDVKKYFEVMDAGYEKNILTKISPIKNSNGKYVVDIEKVVRDLLLVKEALYSVFQKASKHSFGLSWFVDTETGTMRSLEGTHCTILEELTKTQAGSTQSAIDNIAKHYRILLNTILRFAVEAAWLVSERGGSMGRSKREDLENEEVMKLKLTNAELNERLTDAHQEIGEQKKRLALFVGDEAAVEGAN